MHSVPLTSIHQYMYGVFPLCGNGDPPKGGGGGDAGWFEGLYTTIFFEQKGRHQNSS